MNSDQTNPALSRSAVLIARKRGSSRRALSTEVGAPVLDIFQVESLREVMGTNFSETVEVFISTLPEILKDLRSAVAQKNQESFHATALDLKGAANNLGAIALANFSIELEAAGENKNIAAARTLMTRLEGEMQRTTDALRALTEA